MSYALRHHTVHMAGDQTRHPLVISGVVGDVLDPFAGSVEIRILTADGRSVFNGCSLRPSNVAGRPRVEIRTQDDFQGFYTLVMVDPDAPSPSNPHFREYLHWLVMDIPAETSSGSDHGREIVRYESPQPTMGIHRLVLALFRQSRRQPIYAPPQCRRNFCTRNFSQVNNLGSPVAAFYYNCQRENGTGGRRA